MQNVPRGRKPASAAQTEYLQKLLKVADMTLDRALERMREDIKVDIDHDPIRGLCAGQSHFAISYMKRYNQAFHPIPSRKNINDKVR